MQVFCMGFGSQDYLVQQLQSVILVPRVAGGLDDRVSLFHTAAQ